MKSLVPRWSQRALSVLPEQWQLLALCCNLDLERVCAQCQGVVTYDYVTGRAGRAIIASCRECGALHHLFTGYGDVSAPAISPKSGTPVAHLSRVLAIVKALGASSRPVDAPSARGNGNSRRDRRVASPTGRRFQPARLRGTSPDRSARYTGRRIL